MPTSKDIQFESKIQSVVERRSSYIGVEAVGQESKALMSKMRRTEQAAEVITGDPRWAQVAARNPEADGTFVYSVRTTGVYCRPSCAARLARIENIQFHETCAEAEKAGFRPCKRCKPTQPPLRSRKAAIIEKACRLIEASEGTLTLEELAASAGISTSHFHRTFKSITGLTANEYAAAHRAHRMRASLQRNDSVTEAIYDAGFNSSSRFYESSNQVLGMTPSAFRTGGRNTEIWFAIGECSLGAILVAQSERGVCSILIGDDPAKLLEDLQDQFPQSNLIGNQPGFEDLVAKIVGLVEKPGIGLDLPLDIRGTAFQQRVWRALQQIPHGLSVTYTDIANEIGAPRSMRAVAQACAANRLAVAVPCHRVLRNDRSISGYRWGVDRKRALLKREASGDSD